ncbi:23S rRNA (uracil(1939)-C(5))-methyltransferase RlmD [bacterium SCSIO 12696]|nr:23S rRNA (uracil(1939)-C(5))-methyltransferase RlmD [bacterium SCSIO 12696]
MPPDKRRQRRPRKPHPIKLPEPVEVTITDLNGHGRGVSRVAGRTLFIDGGLPGERVLARYRQRRGKFDLGAVQQIIEPSSQRTAPQCRHFGRCGGCQLQHLNHSDQLHHKQLLLQRNLKRIGGVEPVHWLPTIHSRPWGYRRRARLAVRWLKKAGVAELGFRQSGSEQLVAIKQCPILAPPFQELLEPIAALIGELQARERIPQIELLAMDSANAINVHLLGEMTATDRETLRAFGGSHNLQIYRQPAGVETVESLSDGSALSYQLPASDLELHTQPGSFVQVNGDVNRQLIECALELLQLRPDDHVLDLFCGLGNFTLPLARQAMAVHGVEGSTAAIDLARRNADHNGIDNVDFDVADLSRCQRNSSWAAKNYDVVLLDPPRSGAQAVLPLVADSGASRVLYVSCHPGSLARDLGILVSEHGYQLESAGVVDMFPHTAHLESVALLTRNQ